MQSLVSGSECSTSANPLNQLAKHSNRDFSDSASGAFASQPNGHQQIRQGIARQQGGAEDASFFGPQAAFNPGQAAQSFGQAPAFSPAQSFGPAQPAYSQSFTPPIAAASNPAWKEQFVQQNAQQNAQAQVQAQSQGQGQAPAPSANTYNTMNANMGGMYSSSSFNTYRPQFNSYMPMQPQQPQQAQQADKGKFVELDDADWERQFAKLDADTAPATAATDEAEAKLASLSLDSSWKDMQDLNKGEDLDLDAFEADIKAQATNGMNEDELLAKWEKEFSSQFVDDSRLDDDWMEGATLWTPENVDDFLRKENPFPYAEENKYLDQPEDPFVTGHRLLKEGAPLSEAALAFEAACQQDPQRGEAWLAAGETWAADERESRGIRALEKAVGCGGVTANTAWMSLAVAYVNEGQELRALATLEKWITTAYPSLVMPGSTSASLPPDVKQANPWVSSGQVIELFLRAARAGPSIREDGAPAGPSGIDPEVQVGLGVLFYSNSEYDRAKDCFEAALSVRPDDFVLWNRMGATLANGGHPEDAISAYRKALELRPTFTRAIYNLGVSCLNIGCYHEAAEHLLAALKGQKISSEQQKEAKLPFKTASDEGGSNLWHTLRRAFLCMERHDLADLAHPGTSLDAFSKEGFEF